MLVVTFTVSVLVVMFKMGALVVTFTMTDEGTEVPVRRYEEVLTEVFP